MHVLNVHFQLHFFFLVLEGQRWIEAHALRTRTRSQCRQYLRWAVCVCVVRFVLSVHKLINCHWTDFHTLSLELKNYDAVCSVHCSIGFWAVVGVVVVWDECSIRICTRKTYRHEKNKLVWNSEDLRSNPHMIYVLNVRSKVIFYAKMGVCD